MLLRALANEVPFFFAVETGTSYFDLSASQLCLIASRWWLIGCVHVEQLSLIWFSCLGIHELWRFCLRLRWFNLVPKHLSGPLVVLHSIQQISMWLIFPFHHCRGWDLVVDLIHFIFIGIHHLGRRKKGRVRQGFTRFMIYTKGKYETRTFRHL